MPSLTDVLSILRLDGKQALDLLTSPLCIALVVAWIRGDQFATDSIAGLLNFLGIPGSGGIRAVHAWFAETSRSRVLESVGVFLIGLIALSYLNTTRRLTSSDLFIGEKIRLHAASHPEGSIDDPEVKLLRHSRKESGDYFSEKLSRTAVAGSLVTVLYAETGASLWVLAGIAVSTLIADGFVSTLAGSKYRLGDPDFKDIPINTGLALVLLATRLAACILALPVTVLSALVNPDLPRNAPA